MICGFPTLYPDELFYSGCARYSDRLNHPLTNTIVEQLFGDPHARVAIDLPSHLDYFVKSLPPGQNLTIDQIIDQHTLLPFYGPFYPPERLLRLRQDMSSDVSQGIYGRASILAGRISLSDWLYFCPHCIKEDRQHLGEAYWHRIHQIPSVKVCPLHKIFLEQSTLKVRNASSRYGFISAEQAAALVAPRPLQLVDPTHSALLKIASDAQWLLDQVAIAPGHPSLRWRYHQLLHKQGFITPNGRVRKKDLLSSFQQHFSAELLSVLECRLDDDVKQKWLFRLTGSPNGTISPVYHLLLIHFLNYRIGGFLSIPVTWSVNSPFGEGPWPCLNPVCEYYRQRHLMEVPHIQAWNGRKTIIGIFTCPACEFVYSRVGPDQSSTDLFKLSKVRKYGPIWESALREFWKDPAISTTCMAERLGVSRSTTIRQAARLDLPFPAASCNPKKSSGARATLPNTRQSQFNEKRELYRAKWLTILKENSDHSLAMLLKKHHTIYQWFRRNDAAWLSTHLPPHKSRKPPRSSVDWSSRDIQLLQEVIHVGERLKSMESPPKKITITTVARETSYPATILKRLNKLPRTAEALAEIVETREDIAIRRILWVTEQYRIKQTWLTRSQLAYQASLYKILKSPRVQEALDTALQMLNAETMGDLPYTIM